MRMQPSTPGARRVPAGLWALVCLVAEGAAAEDAAQLALEVPRGATFEFKGWVGDRMERNIDAWILPAPAANPGMLEMFRMRDRKPEPQVTPWAGEFAGKYLISSVGALRTSGRKDLRDHVAKFVAELVATQAEDGYLGPFPKKDRLLGNWDLWGHYHIIQGLLRWYATSADKAALLAAVKAADLMVATYLDTGRRVYDAGSHEMNMAAIHGLGALYRLTGKDAYLRLMREIEKDWERAGDYFRAGLAGVDFYRTPRPRWESLHDLQGLVELYRITGDERYRAAFIHLWKSIRDLDRHSTGGFSTGEQAIGDPYAGGAIETCCTIAWMALTTDMIHVSASPLAADELELSTFNGMLGAQHPSGRWWTYNTPMDGVREASAHTIVFQSRAGTPELNCCAVNGPRGLGMLAKWAVSRDAQGLVVNYYGPLRASLELKDGTPVILEQETEYPAGDGKVRISLEPAKRARFALRLRIPAWSAESRVTGPGGEEPRPIPGTYVTVEREWKKGDRIDLELDMRLRVLAGDRSQRGKVALYRGPILLAYDQRWNSFDPDELPAIDAKALIFTPLALETPPPGLLSPRILATIPGAEGRSIRLCDFATAGATGTRYRSWLPAIRTPPPPVLLEEPLDGGKVPAGKILFSWDRGRKARRIPGVEYMLLVSPAADFRERIVVRPLQVKRLLLEQSLDEGRDYFWMVTAQNENGSVQSEIRRFQVDPALEPGPEAPAAEPPEPDADGLLLASALKGDASPSRGVLVDCVGASPGEGPGGEAGGSLCLDGQKGRVRYAIPYFPEEDYSVAVRVSVKGFPQGRIAQVFSAWSGSMDDPLRITVEGGRIFARIEAGAAYSTQGVDSPQGEWFHVAAVKRGTALALYIGGEERSSVEVPAVVGSSAENVGLGGNPNYEGNEYLSACLSDFRLYARALSAEEVRKLAR